MSVISDPLSVALRSPLHVHGASRNSVWRVCRQARRRSALRANAEPSATAINGTNTNFTQPFVLTVNSTSMNATTSSLTKTSGGIGNGQYWSTEHWG